jgi:hypothetical protein
VDEGAGRWHQDFEFRPAVRHLDLRAVERITTAASTASPPRYQDVEPGRGGLALGVDGDAVRHVSGAGRTREQREARRRHRIGARGLFRSGKKTGTVPYSNEQSQGLATLKTPAW